MSDGSEQGQMSASASEAVAQSIAALLRVRLDETAQRDAIRQDRRMASSFELSQLVGDFLKIRDPNERRYCLAVLRSTATSSTVNGVSATDARA